MIIEPKIEIHNDYCTDMDSQDIQAILSQITALVTDAVLRAVAKQKDEDKRLSPLNMPSHFNLGGHYFLLLL